tara:strand:+ start:314 stop:520 length:207 start_codon:yes stop_codon:yes gene_type:complete
VRNSFTDVKKKMVSRYLSKDTDQDSSKSTNINILLNRVKLDQKKESRKKLLFSAAASFSILIFGALIF